MFVHCTVKKNLIKFDSLVFLWEVLPAPLGLEKRKRKPNCSTCLTLRSKFPMKEIVTNGTVGQLLYVRLLASFMRLC